MNHPAWLPTLTELERDCIKALVVTLVLAAVVRHVPELRKLITG